MPQPYKRINLSIAVALYGKTPEEQEKELEWIKKAILMHVCDHPDEILDRVKIMGVEPMSRFEFASMDSDEPPYGWSEEERAQHWTNDPRGE